MKKRLLLSMAAFFAMATMFASLTENYQVYVTAAANGKTNGTAELTLNLKNRTAVSLWTCTLVLPEGVTFQNATLVNARMPESFELVVTDNGDGTVRFTCEGDEGDVIDGTDGAVATVTVAIAPDAPLGDCIVNVKDCKITEIGGKNINRADNEFTWTIEQGEASVTGDLNGDGSVGIGDAVCVLEAMASGTEDPMYDLNQDGSIGIGDFVVVLEIMASN